MVASLKTSEARANAYNPFKDPEWQKRNNEKHRLGHKLSAETRNKISKAMKGKKLSPEKLQLRQQKYFATMRANGRYDKSKMTRPENNAYQAMLSMFSEEDIIFQYKEERYPFNCDFYIKSIDTFIEVNAYYTHGEHPFNKEVDSGKLETINEAFYDAWVVRDPKKLNTAIANGLNYVMLYNKDIFYINKIPRELLETLSKKDNQQPINGSTTILFRSIVA